MNLRRKQQIADVLDDFADGVSIVSACARHGIPRRSFYAAVEADNEIATQFARARELHIEALQQEIAQIADTPALLEETIETFDRDGAPTGRTVKRGDSKDHRRLQIYARERRLAALDPARFSTARPRSGGDEEEQSVIVDQRQIVLQLTQILNAGQQRIAALPPAPEPPSPAATAAAEIGAILENARERRRDGET